MAALNNVATTDGYTTANSIDRPTSVRVRLLVNNAAIFYNTGQGFPATSWELDEHYLPPGLYSLDVVCDALRVRSAAVGTPARVTASLATSEEVGG